MHGRPNLVVFEKFLLFGQIYFSLGEASSAEEYFVFPRPKSKQIHAFSMGFHMFFFPVFVKERKNKADMKNNHDENSKSKLIFNKIKAYLFTGIT